MKKIANLLPRLFPPMLGAVLGSVAVLLYIHLGIAHAAARLADPAVAGAPPIPGAGLDWNFWLAAIGAAAGLASLLLHKLAPKSKVTAEVDAMLAWWRTAAPQSAPQLTIAPPPRNQQAGRARLAALVAIGLIGAALAGAAMIGCATTKPALAAGTIAALDCELADLKPADLSDATALATATVQHWLAGGVAASTAAIKADLAPFKSDLARCALAGSLALATTALTPTPGTATQGLSTAAALDPVHLRAAFGSAAHLLGWPPVKVASGEIL